MSMNCESSVNFIDGLSVHDYVRITGSCPIRLLDASSTTVQTCVSICQAVAEQRQKAGVAPASIAINWSPWYQYFPGNDPTVRGPAEAKEMQFYHSRLHDLREWLGPNYKLVGAFLIDSEKWYGGAGSAKAMQAATRKANLILYNATMASFPDVRYEMFNRGAVHRSDRYRHFTLDRLNANITTSWTRKFRYSLTERGDSFTVSLYQLPDVWLMRDTMRQTVALATRLNSSTHTQTLSVNPWLSLGAGYRRIANRTRKALDLPTVYFDLQYDYDRVISWSFGAEINQPWYGDPGREEMFAPWRFCQVVLLYPSVFDSRSAPAGPHGHSTIMMQHFASYVRGANGLDGTA